MPSKFIIEKKARLKQILKTYLFFWLGGGNALRIFRTSGEESGVMWDSPPGPNESERVYPLKPSPVALLTIMGDPGNHVWHIFPDPPWSAAHLYAPHSCRGEILLSPCDSYDSFFF
jgi:hypothetical protein